MFDSSYICEHWGMIEEFFINLLVRKMVGFYGLLGCVRSYELREVKWSNRTFRGVDRDPSQV